MAIDFRELSQLTIIMFINGKTHLTTGLIARDLLSALNTIQNII